ncbi:sugar transferase [Chryseobacterium glaciei]|uniref:Sugar transferase n=1 Tax=Chryseobacterium glaciei TaxID=1685010 RepID=A0A172XX93_9FLAO|nr:sugar transferase [Chryseobacterium glaciei]ANF51561.1 sugar transferase [Chryseobacterium glaciei]
MNHYKNWKVIFDFIFSIILIILMMPLFIVLFIIISIDTKSNGIFCQKRVGQYGKLFTIYKFKTINEKTKKSSYLGLLLRKTKLDELPQLFNIIKGEMSFVGPRPDIEGYYDKLQGNDWEVLQLKPGVTSEASIKYSNEEFLLKSQKNPMLYNDEVIFPDKVRMNLNYLEKMSFSEDLRIILKTIFKIIK